MTFKKYLPVFITILFIQLNYSQKITKSITYNRNKDKSVSFYYNSDTPCSVLVILKFKNLTNASGNIIKKTITGFGGEIHTLQPIRPNKSIGFSYSAKTIFGNVNAKPNLDFKYILPFNEGKKVKVRNLNYLGEKFGNSAPKNWRSFQFLTKPNDTVIAIRKGVVIKASDGVKTDKTSRFGYKSNVNSIIIEHEDGTFARYSVLKNKSIMVNVGDTVYPSAPIAIAGSYDIDENSQLRLSIYYLDKKILDYDFSKKNKENLKNKTHLNSYVDPVFFLGEGNHEKLEKNNSYIGVFNNSIIEYEMSKREKRKWKKNNLLIKKR